MKENVALHEILSFANQNPACHLATCENNQPHVRGMLMWYADETGFYFHTSSTKKLATQLEANPKVEVAFIRPSENPAEMAAMRVRGEASVLNDEKLEERLLMERPWLKEYEKIAPESSAVIFKISGGEGYIWDMSKNMLEDQIDKVSI